MNELEAIHARHSVRQYRPEPLSEAQLAALRREINACNRAGGLRIQLVTGEPKAFSGFMAHYGKFSGVENYFALIGPKGPELEEKCGYYGERLVLLAQRLGLNTCWVAQTYSKVRDAFTVEPGEKLCAVIALGRGVTRGVERRSKAAKDVMAAADSVPGWFLNGVNAALLAPTAVNQQKFRFTLRGEREVSVKAGLGPYAKIDLGIVKYHFEVGAGAENFRWV